ncbi:hypothetical protein [Brevundimonas nasdae]|uniref:hypothetical protein n=1 Tax=Brevundimonas nasdae TaxID=172043 RepID=UPI0030171F9F
MNYASAQKFVESFLRKANGGTLAIEGDWGVGKTYVCKEALKAMLANPVPFTGVCYVSAYYLTSISDLRYATFSGFKSIRSRESETLGHYLIYGSGKWIVSKARRYIRILRTFGIARFVDAESASLHLSQTVKRAVVIIDDVERHQSGLSAELIFSHIAQLRDEQNCSVIVIVNEDQLGSDRSKYRSELDKFTDHHVRLTPSSSDAVGLIVPDDDTYRALRESIITLEIVNIRVIRRIFALYTEIINHIGSESASLKIGVAKACAVYGSAYFGAEPAYRDFVDNKLIPYALKPSGVLTSEELKYSTRINSVQMNVLSGEIAPVKATLKSGGVTPEIVSALKAESKKYSDRPNSIFHESWNKYHNDANAEEFEIVSGWLCGFTDEITDRTHSDLDGTFSTLVSLGRYILADYILEKFINNASHTPAMLDPNNTWMSISIKDERVRDALLEAHARIVRSTSPEQILEKDVFFDDDIKVLLDQPDEWFVNFIKREGYSYKKNIDMLNKVRINSADGVALSKRIDGAKKAVANESQLNRIRMGIHS